MKSKRNRKEWDQAKDDEEFICQNEFVDTMITNQSNSSFFSQLKYIWKYLLYTWFLFYYSLFFTYQKSFSYINQPCENHLEIIS